MPAIYLASGSPRRKELLALLGVPFEVLCAPIVEQRQPLENPQDYVRRLALEKALAGVAIARNRARYWVRIRLWCSMSGFWKNPATRRMPP